MPPDIRPVDFTGGEHKSPAFLARNPFGEIPVPDDDGLVLRDSQAIVVYLARKFGGEAWLPTGAKELAQVMQWVSPTANDVTRGCTFKLITYLSDVEQRCGVECITACIRRRP